MWVLRSLQNSDVSYVLVPGESYKVGRIDAEILVKDESVSRLHGEFKVRSKPEIPVFESEVIYQDLGSKFGSYVGEDAITSSQSEDKSAQRKDSLKKGQCAKLTQNTRIRLGLLSSIFKLEWQTLTLTSSTLKEMEKEQIRNTLNNIGNGKHHKLINDWNDDVTLLVMNRVTITVKVANALAKGVPIVKPEYIEDFFTCIKTKQEIPDPSRYVPPLSEKTIRPDNVSLVAMKERQTVFKGKLFAFATSSQMEKVQSCISYGGGQAVVFGTPESKFKDPKIFEIPNNMLIQKEPSFTASPSKREQFKLIKEAEAILDARGYKCVPMSSIGLAILFCSTEVHCNPEKHVIAVPRSSNPCHPQITRDQLEDSQGRPNSQFVPETQLITQSPNGARTPMTGTYRSCIPETLPSENQKSPSPAEFIQPEPKKASNPKNQEKSSTKVTRAVPMTSTQAGTQPSSLGFWGEPPFTDQDSEPEDNLWGLEEPKKRKNDSDDISSAAKRPCTENKRDVELTEVSPDVPDKKPRDATLATLDDNITQTSETLDFDFPTKKRLRSEDSDDDCTDPKISRKDDLAFTTYLPNRQINSVLSEQPNHENSQSTEVTIVDVFGFIGKSFIVKSEFKNSDENTADDSDDKTRTFCQIRTVSLVVETTFSNLRIQDSESDSANSNGLNQSKNSLKRFKKQPVAGQQVNPVECKVIEEEKETDFSIVMDEDGQQTKLDDWVKIQREEEEDVKTSNQLWDFAVSQKKPPVKRR